MAKWLLYGLIGVVVLILSIGFAIPGRWQVTRSVHVAAPPATVFGLVADLKRWPDWTEWNATSNPSVQWRYSGPATGAGASMEWQGKQLGAGRIDVTSMEPGKTMRFQVFFTGHEPTSGTLTVQREGDGSNVTWVMDGDAGPNPIIHLFVPQLKGALGAQLDEELSALANLAQTGQSRSAGKAAPK